MDPGIAVSGLRKHYGGTAAVDGLTFTVPAGHVTGFIGPNGAGKTTTMRMILGLAAPDAGEARVSGLPYRSLRTPLREIGSLLDASALHPGRRARDHLLWIAHSNGLPRRRVDEVLELVGLSAVAGRRAGGFSLGMRQRLGLAAALIGDPRVLVLDEPVNGLDPEGIWWIRGLLRALAEQGRAVLVSSHLMGELEGTADRILVIGRGRLLADTTTQALIDAASTGRVTLRTPRSTDAMVLLASAGATAEATASDTVTVSGLTGEDVVAVLAGAGVPFSEVTGHRASLEEAYRELTRDAVEFRDHREPTDHPDADRVHGGGS